MKFTRQQKQEAYKKLPSEVKDFIMNDETDDLISGYLTGAGLTEEQSNDADAEILYAMYGLQTLPQAIEAIAKLSNKNVSDLSILRANLENNIFGQIEKIKNYNAIVDKTIENKIREIATKYSLSESQTSDLIDRVSSVLFGKTTVDDFFETLDTDIHVSSLVAEQIMEDLYSRVFEAVTDQVERAPSLSQSSNLELAPDNLPMTEPGEVAHDAPRQPREAFAAVPRYVPPVAEVVTLNPQLKNQIENQLEKQPDKKAEQYTGASQVTPAPSVSAPDNLPGIEIIPEKKYVSDPYREPLQ